MGSFTKDVNNCLCTSCYIKSIIDLLEQVRTGKTMHCLVLLIMGTMDFSEDEICNHDCKYDGGNEGFLYIYSKGIDH